MKIYSRQFYGKNHSWAIVGRNIMRSLKKMGHEVNLFSTDGIKHFPEDLKPNLCAYNVELNNPKVVALRPMDKEYDAQISYTAMKNFKPYLSQGKKNRFGIYNYDGSVLPKHWRKSYLDVDFILPSSQYAKKVFLDAKIPESSLKVVPHGINIDDFQIKPDDVYPLRTEKSIKILNVCGQVHRRKNLEGILEAYGKAFTEDDDVCLVLKVADKAPKAKFEVSFCELYKEWRRKNPKAGEVEIIYDYIDRIETLFVACDVHFSLSNIECFHIPSLQALAANCLTLQSGYGGHTDFLNVENAFLVDGQMGRCPPHYQYWTPSPYASMFIPDIDDAVDKLRHVVNNYESLKDKMLPSIQKTVEQFTWDNATQQILDLMI